ncbi:MAG: DNA (cytosine-5-)-methyltransferase [Deltaproteobacteria bacterium]|nr:DNA (cytosine-5-)-methyltransferase [Deltaproteobacteria bacterium]
MRLAFESTGSCCVFSSEIDSHAQKTYEANFGDIPAGDITKVDEAEIPDHDILIAGFPCQPFSIAGVSKKISLSRPHGFLDKTQGTLFFDVARILNVKRPRAFLLENVKNLVSHDKGKTFATILDTLEEMGYVVHHRIVDARAYVPQHRERIYIVGFLKNLDFSFPKLPSKGPQLGTIFEKNIDEKYTLSTKLWKYLQDYAAKHKAKGNGFGYGLFDESGVARTLSARYYKDGSEILINRGIRKNPRRLTPRECARLMGFQDNFKIVVSDTQAYRQFGNSVVVPVVSEIARAIVDTLNSSRLRKALVIKRPKQYLLPSLDPLQVEAGS